MLLVIRLVEVVISVFIISLCIYNIRALVYDPWRGELDTTLCDKVCQWLATGRWFSLGVRFPPRIKLTATIYWNIVESGVKHHSPIQTIMGIARISHAMTSERSDFNQIDLLPYLKFLLVSRLLVVGIVYYTLLYIQFPRYLRTVGKHLCRNLQVDDTQHWQIRQLCHVDWYIMVAWCI